LVRPTGLEPVTKGL